MIYIYFLKKTYYTSLRIVFCFYTPPRPNPQKYGRFFFLLFQNLVTFLSQVFWGKNLYFSSDLLLFLTKKSKILENNR
jgi:hypothetical protein